MKKVYNIATIELSRIFHGPGNVIGVLAVPADSLDVELKFRDEIPKDFPELLNPPFKNEQLPTIICSVRKEIEALRKAAQKMNLSGLELIRAITAPRKSTKNIVVRGTRYCDEGQTAAMMDELLQRYIPASSIGLDHSQSGPVA